MIREDVKINHSLNEIIEKCRLKGIGLTKAAKIQCDLSSKKSESIRIGSKFVLYQFFKNLLKKATRRVAHSLWAIVFVTLHGPPVLITRGKSSYRNLIQRTRSLLNYFKIPIT